MDFSGHPHDLDALEMTGLSTQPLRKSSRRVSKNEPQVAAPPSYSASTRAQPQTANAPKNATGKRKRGRPTRAEEDNDNHVPSSVTPGRESYLEKNRRAAQRCRERKKVEQEELCRKAQDWSFDNAQLKHTVSALQEEAFVLKTELLRHANCGFGPVEDYLQKSAKRLANAGLEERRKPRAERDDHHPSRTLLAQDTLLRFPIETRGDITQVSRPASQCSLQTPQSTTSFSEQSLDNDTTPSSISSAILSPPTNKYSGHVNGPDFTPTSFSHCDELQSSTKVGGAEGNSPDFVDLSNWAAI